MVFTFKLVKNPFGFLFNGTRESLEKKKETSTLCFFFEAMVQENNVQTDRVLNQL